MGKNLKLDPGCEDAIQSILCRRAKAKHLTTDYIGDDKKSNGTNLTVAVQADCKAMEEETKMAETEQGDVASNERESTGEISNSRVKRGRGRPQGSRKLKVSVTDVNLVVSGISNGGSTQSPRKRGRPSLAKPAEQQGSGDDRTDDSVQTSDSKKEASNADGSPKRRGRPRKSLSKNPSEKADVNVLPNGGSDEPKVRRGRPKGSKKRQSESVISEENEGGSVTQQKQTRSLNKKPRLETAGRRLSGQVAAKPHIGRGRPRKMIVQKGKEELVSGSQPDTRGRGRPRKQPAKRGRPRKYPLPSPEELKKPKVWKPLGRPRKYPRVEPPEGSLPAPRRSRGRPCKAESKKGAHLRMSSSASSSSPANPNVGSLRKRGRPPSAAKKDAAPLRGRGRPKAHTDTPIEHDSGAAIEHDSEDNTEESIIDQDTNFEVSNQA